LILQEEKFSEQAHPKLIKLNVGGCKFLTTLATLTSVEDSKLHKMFTGKLPLCKDDKDNVFLDRNGDTFAHILDFLRDGKLILPDDPFKRQKIKEEMEYFELSEKKKSGSSNPKWALDPNKKHVTIKLTDDNLTASKTDSVGVGVVYGDLEFTEGTYEWEVNMTNLNGGTYWIALGVFDINENPGIEYFNYGNTWGISSEGNVYRMGSPTTSFLSEKAIVKMSYNAGTKEFTLKCDEKNINLTTQVTGTKIYPYLYLWQVGNSLTVRIP